MDSHLYWGEQAYEKTDEYVNRKYVILSQIYVYGKRGSEWKRMKNGSDKMPLIQLVKILQTKVLIIFINSKVMGEYKTNCKDFLFITLTI